jgi:hypothetical protein
VKEGNSPAVSFFLVFEGRRKPIRKNVKYFVGLCEFVYLCSGFE